jgi:CheY-like chemotaxis protein
MSGYEAVAELRAKGYEGPIVAVTASALKGEREKCIESGMNDILVKPFKRDELADLLAKYLPELGAARASPDTKTEASAERVLDASIFDWTGVLDTFLGQKETVSSLLSRFIAKAGGQMEELAAALEAKDAQKFREVSHSLKGASWNLSAKKLGDSALAGETAGRENDMVAAEAALALMRAAYADFVEAAKPYAKAP